MMWSACGSRSNAPDRRFTNKNVVEGSHNERDTFFPQIRLCGRRGTENDDSVTIIQTASWFPYNQTGWCSERETSRGRI